MFGASLVDIMQMQQEKYPDLRLPWILTTLAETVLEHKGAQTEGIFRSGPSNPLPCLALSCLVLFCFAFTFTFTFTITCAFTLLHVTLR